MDKEKKVQGEKEEKQEVKKEEKTENKEKELNEQISKLKDELADVKDRHTRLIAEFDNLKKRSAKEREGLYNSIIGDIISSLLPVIDNLEKATEAETKDEEYKKGIELVLKQFKDVLTANGVKEIEAVGQPFDPELHEAVSMIQDEKLGEKIVFNYEEEHLIGYSFPGPEVLAKADLSEFKFGYREKYIRQTAEDILTGKFELSVLQTAVAKGASPEEGKEMLKKLHGVGEKVASCIQLFGLHQLSLFPIDTWIAKVEKMYYNGHFPVERYEGIAGVMQQYLFFRVREEAEKRACLEVKADKMQKEKPEEIRKNVSKEVLRKQEKKEYNLSGKMLYVSDLDGTLLNSDALLNEDVPKRLNALIEQGLCFTVATARTYATVNSIMKDVNLTCPMILMNGVMIYDPVKKSCIHAEIIERDSVEYILKGRKKFGVTGFAYALSPEISEDCSKSGETSVVDSAGRVGKSGRKMATYYEKIATQHMEKFYTERRDLYHKPFSKVERLEDISGEDIIYFSICYEEEVLRPFYEYLKKDERLNLNFYKDVYGDGLWYLEISHKNASKYYGIQKLRKLLHPAAITGMGDNLNDIPLFEACDRSCAVGNAHKEVKERADYILDTNLNAGVVKFLEKEMK